MRKFWIDNQGRDERFWKVMAVMNFMSPFTHTTFKHEWAAHGTCYSTLQFKCLPRGSPRGTEAVLYFRRTVELFKQLPTYKWLAQQKITPSRTRTYTLSEVINALKKASGVRCMLLCSSVVLMTNIVRSIPQPSGVTAMTKRGSTRSVGIFISGAQSSTANLSPLVRGIIHTV